MVDGWPIAHHVFAGNWRDAKTVPQVLNDLNERFGLHRVVFVGDRGMVTSDSLAVVRSRKQGYLVGAAKTTARGGLSLHRARQRRVDRLPWWHHGERKSRAT